MLKHLATDERKCSIKSGEVFILYVFHVALFFCGLFFGIICNFNIDLPLGEFVEKIPLEKIYTALGEYLI